MSNVSRRDFLKRTLASGVAGSLVISGAEKMAEAAVVKSPQYGTMIEKPPVGIPQMEPNVGNFLDTPNGMAKAVLIAPIAGAFATGYTVFKTMKGEEK